MHESYPLSLESEPSFLSDQFEAKIKPAFASEILHPPLQFQFKNGEKQRQRRKSQRTYGFSRLMNAKCSNK